MSSKPYQTNLSINPLESPKPTAMSLTVKLGSYLAAASGTIANHPIHAVLSLVTLYCIHVVSIACYTGARSNNPVAVCILAIPRSTYSRSLVGQGLENPLAMGDISATPLSLCIFPAAAVRPDCGHSPKPGAYKRRYSHEGHLQPQLQEDPVL